MTDHEKQYYKETGEIVRQARELKGMTLTELAKRMGMKPSLLSDFESKGEKLSAFRINQAMEILTGETFPEKKTRLTLKLRESRKAPLAV